MEQQPKKYLKITICDNDFWHSLSLVGDLLQELFWFMDRYPTEDQLEFLKVYIKHIWFGTNGVEKIVGWGNGSPIDISYFEPDLKIVDFADIPEWDNDESIYIPMFDGGEIITR